MVKLNANEGNELFFLLLYFNDVGRTEIRECGSREESNVNCWGQGQIGDGDRQITISVDSFFQRSKSFSFFATNFFLFFW